MRSPDARTALHFDARTALPRPQVFAGTSTPARRTYCGRALPLTARDSGSLSTYVRTRATVHAGNFRRQRYETTVRFRRTCARGTRATLHAGNFRRRRYETKAHFRRTCARGQLYTRATFVDDGMRQRLTCDVRAHAGNCARGQLCTRATFVDDGTRQRLAFDVNASTRATVHAGTFRRRRHETTAHLLLLR